MSTRKVKVNGVLTKFAFDKSKKYKYDNTGNLVEATTVSDNDIILPGSKSSLRRIAELERNVSILATRLTTSDGGTTDADDASFDSITEQDTRFKGVIRFDQGLDIRAGVDMNSTRITELQSPSSATDAANKSYVDTAISNLVNGASASFDTLKEIQNAMATDAELSAAINGLTIGNGTMTISAGSGITGGGSFTANQTGSSSVTISHGDTSSVSNLSASGRRYVTGLTFDGAGHVTGYSTGTETVVNTDTNTTYTAGNGLTLSGTQFLMSGSYSGNFTATGDITAYSDDSLKTNVQVIDGALGRVEAIRGVTFERIEDGSVSTGVIAQELEAVLPEAVKTDAHGVRHVAYGNITGLLIEAVKELSAQVAELKASK